VARVLLLLPSATYRAPDFLAAARALEVDVVVASDIRQTLADAMGDRALQLDFDQTDLAVEEIAALSKRAPLDAIVAVDDQGVVLAAAASQRLGLPTNSPAAVAATRDKAAMRRLLADAAVHQPDFRVCRAGDDAARLATGLGFPCVVKPVSLSGSRGVIRADDAESVMAAVARVRRILDDAGEAPDAPLLIERFVPGDEVALEGMLRAGHLEVLAIFDKPDPLNGPYFEETIYVTPSRKPASTLAAIGERATDAARAVGLREGPVHAELRIAGDDVWVLEFAARSIGGLCSRTLRFGTGVRLEELILRHALGLSLDDSQRETAAAGVMMLPIPEGGVLRAVNGRDDVLAVPGITGLELTIHVGRRVRPLPEGDRYLGFLFARAATPDSVEQALRDAHRRLEVVVTPG
jgi:biotin carboxylase